MKDRLTQLVTRTALVAGLALIGLAGLVVAAIPVALALPFLAIAAVRRRLGHARARLFRMNPRPGKEAT